jgi:hypothetical protein
MSLLKEILRISDLMNINESLKTKNNIFDKFDIEEFKNFPPTPDNSSETKKEIDFLKNINLKQKFVQEKDDIEGNFVDVLKLNGINEKKLINKICQDVRKIILELKLFYKRPRPFRLDSKLNDRLLDLMEGFAYPSGHSTQSYLLYYVLSDLYPNLRSQLLKTTEDIVFSRQMARAHYPSDIRFGKKLAKSLYEYLKNNNLINKIRE